MRKQEPMSEEAIMKAMKQDDWEGRAAWRRANPLFRVAVTVNGEPYTLDDHWLSYEKLGELGCFDRRGRNVLHSVVVHYPHGSLYRDCVLAPGQECHVENGVRITAVVTDSA